MSGPASFFDPFVSVDHHLIPKPGGKLLLQDRKNAIRVAPNTTALPILGRGTIVVSSEAADMLLFTIKTKTLGAPDLFLQIGNEECKLFFGNEGQATKIPTTFLKGEKACFLRSGVPTTYWFSIDNPNGVLSYGKYYTNKALTLMQATLKTKTEAGVMVWTDPTEYSWLDELKGVKVMQDKGEQVSFDHRLVLNS